MQFQNSRERWGLVAQGFHWLIAVLIVAAWAAHAMYEDAPRHSAESRMWLEYHKSLGLTVLVVAALRLLWRLANPAPAPVVVSPRQAMAASAVHAGLYALMFAMPVAGLLMSQFGGHPVSWFGVLDLPALVGPDKSLSGVFHVLHTDVFWLATMALLGLHVGAAVWHQWVVKDRLIQRMLP